MAEIEKIADYYGYISQCNQLNEEMAELTQALSKFWRKSLYYGQYPVETVLKAVGKPHRTDCNMRYNNIVEEIGDVEICLEQIKYLLKCEEQVKASKERKIARELRRIEG
jgi:hypothetical protein